MNLVLFRLMHLCNLSDIIVRSTVLEVAYKTGIIYIHMYERAIISVAYKTPTMTKYSNEDDEQAVNPIL